MSSDDSRRAIGKITSVAADRFIVELHRGNDNFTVVGFDDIHYVARLGSFVIIPVQSDYVVTEVVGLRKADPRNRLPVHLILEEAHRYVAEKPTRHAIDASRIFERIAKEGRKYGMFLQVASQRPSELSKTVLSQCSNFVIHRIQNPDDLSHIRQMTPFISESVMKRLPSLPKQHALIFGNAVNLPTTFKVRDVNPRPKSDDAAIRELWFKADNEPTELNFIQIQENEVTAAPEPAPTTTAAPLDDEIPF